LNIRGNNKFAALEEVPIDFPDCQIPQRTITLDPEVVAFKLELPHR